MNPTSITKKLFDAIEKCKSPIKSIKSVTNLDTQLSKEIYLFTSGGSRGKYLQAAYSYLGTILPTSMIDCGVLITKFVQTTIFFFKLFRTITYLFWNPNNFLKTNVFVYLRFFFFFFLYI